MNNYYFIGLSAFILAQLLMASINVYNYQKKKEIKYLAALSAYVQAEVGYFIIGIIGIFCVCFILKDFININITEEDLRHIEKRTWKENMQLYFRSSAFFIGAFIQYLAFKYRTTGKKAIDKAIDSAI